MTAHNPTPLKRDNLIYKAHDVCEKLTEPDSVLRLYMKQNTPSITSRPTFQHGLLCIVVYFSYILSILQ